jgi:hypothetical protein
MAEPHDDGVRAAYREPSNDHDERRAQPENELFYFPESDRHTSPIGAVYGLLLPVLVAVAATAILQSPAIGLLAGVALLAWAFWRRRRAQVLPRATLRVDDGRLELNGPAFGQPVNLDLKDLLDVYLDTKTIRRVQDGPSIIPAVRLLNQTVGGEQDMARIALELRNETFYLTQERTSHLDANEWFGKIRRFLRKYGWVPEDERQV